MSRRFSFLTHFLLAVLLITPLSALAEIPNSAPTLLILLHFLTLLESIIGIVIYLAFVVFGWGIIKLITAGGSGDQKRITDAKRILVYGIIGLFVLSSMFGILTFIKTYLGVPDNTPITVPKFQ